MFFFVFCHVRLLSLMQLQQELHTHEWRRAQQNPNKTKGVKGTAILSVSCARMAHFLSHIHSQVIAHSTRCHWLDLQLVQQDSGSLIPRGRGGVRIVRRPCVCVFLCVFGEHLLLLAAVAPAATIKPRLPFDARIVLIVGASSVVIVMSVCSECKRIRSRFDRFHSHLSAYPFCCFVYFHRISPMTTTRAYPVCSIGRSEVPRCVMPALNEK